MSDDELEAQIRCDRIDILVDLAGHTAGHRLLVFARKPAPIQVTAWGFATGTGMPSIDFMFSDSVSIPAGVRHLYTEEIVDLPCCICYEAPGDAPQVSALPALQGRPFTFGNLNRTEKMSDRAVALWARILKAMPDSRLLLKSASQGIAAVRAAVLDRFARHQIGPERLILRGLTDLYDHLAALHEVDLALDPFPASGGITTAETLWMGVPVVTLLGETTHGRNSAAILTALGMPDWIARDEEEYLRIALEFAEDPSHLARLREEMRQKLSATPVFDTGNYTRCVEAAYRNMWLRWCHSGASKRLS
jgi:predicted O-linked N-acetylglucosamine transferase (SPINDLY family)